VRGILCDFCEVFLGWCLFGVHERPDGRNRRRQPLAYIATLDADLARRWFYAATVDSSNRRLLTIRAYMSLRDQEVYPCHC
jgi:hypothetical protein